MSPTSRWSRKRTPLTTRPSLTSRQGMILRAGMGQRLGHGEAAFPQGLADDRTGGARFAKLAKLPRIGDSAGGLDIPLRQRLGALADQVEIGAGEHAVAGDVGDQQVP